MKINLRESLNKIDLATDNRYDLLNTFDSKKLSDDSKKKLAEAIDNNSIASINKILNEEIDTEYYSEEELAEPNFKVILRYGPSEILFEDGLTYEEAENLCDEYGYRWLDEKGFLWEMDIEDNSYELEECMNTSNKLNESSDFAIDTFGSFSPEYAKLSAICILLNSMSPNKINYRVEDTYFDYGQDWKWTTIIAHRNNGDSWQAIYPAMQERILLAGDFDATDTAEFVNDPEFEEIAKDILRESRLDKGFNESLDDEVLYENDKFKIIYDGKFYNLIGKENNEFYASYYNLDDAKDDAIKDPFYESLTEAINAKDSMVAQEFNYTMQYGDQSSDVNAAVIVIPGGLMINGEAADLTVYAEDENGEVINFKSVEEANDWINKYKDDVEFHVEHGNELHATPSAYYNSFDESLTENKKVGSNKISQGMNLPGKNFELVKVVDGVVSSKDRYECRIYSRELDSNYKTYGFYQGEVIFSEDYDPQLIDSVFPDEGTKVKLAIYKVPEDDPDHDWTGDYFVDYIDETNESLSEADYGGAYDIENDMFFTKEDIVEFAEEICEYLGDIFGYQYDINNVYMDGPRKLYINIYDNNYIEVESTFNIDMRKIRKPSDLSKVYGLTIENWFQKAFAREYRDAGLDESLKESTDFSNKFLDIETNLRSDYYIRMKSGKEKVDTVYLQYEPSIDDYPHLVGYAHDDEGHYDWAYLDSSYIENLDVSPYMDSNGNIIDINRMIEENPDYFYIKFNEGPISFDESLNESSKSVIIGTMTLDHEIPNWTNYAESPKYDEYVTALPSTSAVTIYPYSSKELGHSAYWSFKAIDADGKETRANTNTYLYMLGKYLDGYKGMTLELNSNWEWSDKYPYLIFKGNNMFEDLTEDTVKTKSGEWVNKGDTGETHGEFKTKKAADAQRKAIFAQGWKKESLEEKLWFGKYVTPDHTLKKVYFYNNYDNFDDADADFDMLIPEPYIKKTLQGKADYEILLKNDGYTLLEKLEDKDEEKVAVFTRSNVDDKTYYHGFMKKEDADKYYPDRLKEDFEDEMDIDYETDFDDDGVEEGNTFIEDGVEYAWVERIAGPVHLDFDNWAVWEAREYVDPRDYITITDSNSYEFDDVKFKQDSLAKATVYFVVDEDTGFIDWGPVETSTEAQDFLNGKVEDYENDEEYEEVEIEEESLTESINQNDVFKFLDEIKDTVSSFKNRVQEVSEYFNISEDEAEDFVYDWEQENSLTESRSIRNDGDYEVTLHYDDIGNGKEYDYTLGYDEVVSYLKELAWANGDGPEDLNEDEYLEWVMDNFDELADKYELNVLNYFESEASQYEYDHRYDEP